MRSLFYQVRLTGIEPAHPAPEAGALSTELQAHELTAFNYSTSFSKRKEENEKTGQPIFLGLLQLPKSHVSKACPAPRSGAAAKHAVGKGAVPNAQADLSVYREGDLLPLAAQLQPVGFSLLPGKGTLRQSGEAEIVLHEHQLVRLSQSSSIAAHGPLRPADKQMALPV